MTWKVIWSPKPQFQRVDQGDQLTHSEMGMRSTWIFFFCIKQHIFRCDEASLLEFHDTENDNCNQKNYHMFMTFKTKMAE